MAEVIQSEQKAFRNMQHEGDEKEKQYTVKETVIAKNKANWFDHLHPVISNLYQNAVEQLCMEYPPKCSEEWEYCLKTHYNAPHPDNIDTTTANLARLALEQKRYLTFCSNVAHMCIRVEWPGDGIFTKLLELILSINTENNAEFAEAYREIYKNFFLIVRVFPPCWRALRPYYKNFFQHPVDYSKISANEEQQSKSVKPLDVLLDLLEKAIQDYEPNIAAASDKETQNPFSMNSSNFLTYSEINLEQLDWEESQDQKHNFMALRPDIRMERLFVALRHLVIILEYDLVMWLIHNHNYEKEIIFNKESSPLVVEVFAMTAVSRFTKHVERIFTLFAIAVKVELSGARLQVLERYITLIMIASNYADIEHTTMGVKFPYLGMTTKTMILELFNIFKAHSTSKLAVFISAIKLLRVPFVRYEYIDIFLQQFNSYNNGIPNPGKTVLNILNGNWTEYRRQDEIKTRNELSLEKYLELLLLALKAYCDWRGLKKLIQAINHKKYNNLEIPTASVHQWPKMDKELFKEMKTSKEKFDMSESVMRPKYKPLIDKVHFDEQLISKYEEDLFQVEMLHAELPKRIAENPETNFKDWQEFLKNIYTADSKKK